MRKITALVMCLFAILSLAACGNSGSGENAQLPNPFVDYETPEEMQKAAGLEVTLPENLPDWVSETLYRAIPGELVEVIYTDGDNEIRVRVKEGSEDISGVYDSGSLEERDVPLGENTAHLKGETLESGEFSVQVCIWSSSEGRSYSVTSRNGVPEDILLPIAAQVS
ncbi:MAG: hypothetical protein ACOX68_04425 [Candidatus Limivicinus sp.]|jgi:hypothetical protein